VRMITGYNVDFTLRTSSFFVMINCTKRGYYILQIIGRKALCISSWRMWYCLSVEA